MEDIRALCAGSEPGGGKVMMCLKSHKDQVSDGCKAATAALRECGGGPKARSVSDRHCR